MRAFSKWDTGSFCPYVTLILWNCSTILFYFFAYIYSWRTWKFENLGTVVFLPIWVYYSKRIKCCRVRRNIIVQSMKTWACVRRERLREMHESSFLQQLQWIKQHLIGWLERSPSLDMAFYYIRPITCKGISCIPGSPKY